MGGVVILSLVGVIGLVKKVFIGLDMLEEMEQEMKVIKNNLKVAHLCISTYGI